MASQTTLLVFADVVGWGYFLAWTVSFYPQIYENFRRRSVVGLSFDMIAYFMISYVAYLIYNVVVYFDLDVQREILGKSHESSPVKLTDVVFAILGFVCNAILSLQCVVFERGSQRMHTTTWLVAAGFALSLAVLCALAGFKVTSWLVMLEYCGYVKLVVSFGSYAPQVWLNYHRKCTEGFHICGVLLDFTGGVLSLLQMDIYCVIEHSNQQLTGNIPKLLLGIITLVFNLILILQHFVVYVGNTPPEPVLQSEERQSLIDSNDSTRMKYYSVNVDAETDEMRKDLSGSMSSTGSKNQVRKSNECNV